MRLEAAIFFLSALESGTQAASHSSSPPSAEESSVTSRGQAHPSNFPPEEGQAPKRINSLFVSLSRDDCVTRARHPADEPDEVRARELERELLVIISLSEETTGALRKDTGVMVFPSDSVGYGSVFVSTLRQATVLLSF